MCAYSPPQVDRIWGIWGSYCNIPKAIFYLLKEDYKSARAMQAEADCLAAPIGLNEHTIEPEDAPNLLNPQNNPKPRPSLYTLYTLHRDHIPLFNRYKEGPGTQALHPTKPCLPSLRQALSKTTQGQGPVHSNLSQRSTFLLARWLGQALL